MKKKLIPIEWLIPLLIVVVVLVIGGREVIREHSSEYKYKHPSVVSFDESKQMASELSQKGDALVSQLGPIEDEYNLMNSLVFKFMNQVVKEFPGRVIDTSVLEKSRRGGDFWRGKITNDGLAHSQEWSDGDYLINIEDINNPQTIQRFWEIAKSIFEPAGFHGGNWLPSRHMGNGLIDFNWVFVKPSGISDPHITWNNDSVIRVGGQGNLLVSFSTGVRFMKDDLKKYRAASASTTSTVTNQK